MAHRPSRLPVPLSLMASGTAQHNLQAAKQILEDHLVLMQGRLYADKAYTDAAWAETLKKNHTLQLLTPPKKRKGDVIISGDTFSTFVRSIRQPIECFFNWINRLTNIQFASLVRSLSSLPFHVFGRIAAAIVSLIFSSWFAFIISLFQNISQFNTNVNKMDFNLHL